MELSDFYIGSAILFAGFFGFTFSAARNERQGVVSGLAVVILIISALLALNLTTSSGWDRITWLAALVLGSGPATAGWLFGWMSGWFAAQRRTRHRES